MTYTIKEKPEYFKVTEILPTFSDTGDYLLCTLTKVNYNTLQVIEQLAKTLRIQPKHIGYCGIKDKNAITTQYISLKASQHITQHTLSRLQLPFTLTYVQRIQRPLFIGSLKGNAFEITVTHAKEYTLTSQEEMINYFGEQRFSQQNQVVGKYLVKKQFKEAVSTLLDSVITKRYADKMHTYLRTHPTDYIGSLRLLPKKLITLFTHAYQSHLWNICATRYITQQKGTYTMDSKLSIAIPTKISHIPQVSIPLIGFDYEESEYDNTITTIVTELLLEEGITPRSFIQKQMPELTVTGAKRPIKVPIQKLSTVDFDEIKILSFTLQKGSYATIALLHLLQKTS